MKAVLKAEEAADLLDCEVETVNLRAASGDLPALKFGRSWIFPFEALMARLNELACEESVHRRTPKRPTPVRLAAQSNSGPGKRRGSLPSLAA